MAGKKEEGVFDNLTAATKPRDLAWDNWAKFPKVGTMFQGYIRDVFFRPAEGDFDAQRGITLEQEDGTLVNVGIKRFSFILDKTDKLHIGDVLRVTFIEQKPPAKKGVSGVKVFSYDYKELPENAGNPTVLELDPHEAPVTTAKKDFDSIEGADEVEVKDGSEPF